MSTRVKVLYCFDFDLLNVAEDKNGNIYIFEYAYKDKKCENMLEINEVIVGKSVYLDEALLGGIPKNEFNNMCQVILDSKG